ncbi:MAG: Unknown protein [uncultured Sulfurovum sp.]|uniref:Transposase IS200-like domain-containing protein n=1 Tax=uncultured Sulfurovum sp. TaxID=269237 RepID=A0A6S6SPV1_9BACT|nr:MAG: Unknown protein [uncultured Sulfurovum sp.]
MSSNRHRKSIRLKTWDYSQNGLYFITICTKNREHLFGEIIDETMLLSDMGLLAQKYWYEIPKHFDFVFLDSFVVMPNHIHGVIEIRREKAVKKFENQPKGTVSSIIGSYKSIVTKKCRLIDASFGWQSRFHDHIIRNDKSLEKIRAYVIANPKNWKDDMLYRKISEIP